MGFGSNLFTLQVLIVLAAFAVAGVSLGTSRSHRMQHSSYLALAIMLVVLAVLVLTLTLLLAAAQDEAIAWLAFGPPALTAALCVIPVIRSVQGKRKRERELASRSRSADPLH